MKKTLFVIFLAVAIISCVSKPFATIEPGGIYEIADFSIQLEDSELIIENTSYEQLARFQVWVEYLNGEGAVLGAYSNVGMSMGPGDKVWYPLAIPVGTEKVNVMYREYFASDGGMFFRGSRMGKIPVGGSVVFLLKK